MLLAFIATPVFCEGWPVALRRTDTGEGGECDEEEGCTAHRQIRGTIELQFEVRSILYGILPHHCTLVVLEHINLLLMLVVMP